jgi:hypothetical protein
MFDFFGFSVAVRGDLVVIGSVLDSTFAFNGGAAYLFTRAQNVWSQDSEFSAGNLGEDYHFGFSVALDHATVLVGAPSGSSMDEGTAYAFALAPSNTAPLATSQSVTTSEDATVPIILSGSDPEGDPLTYTVLSAPLKGTLTGTPPNLSYTPDANANGSDSFTFKVKDGELDSAPASVSINIVPENDRPAISSLSEQTIDENSTTGPIAFAVTDVDNDPASLIVSKSSDNPALVPDSSISLTSGTDRTVTVTPAANQFGAATITLTVSDGLMIAQTSFVLNVRQANLPPVADASATPTRVISANNVDAVVTLDGSRSHDPASDPLAFTWFEGGNIIGAGVVSRRTLAVGTHAITLTVSDGANSESTTVSVRVMTLAQSIYELIAAVQAANIAQDEKSALIATLQAAANSCARGNLNAAVNQLWTFVSKVNAQTGKAIDSATASELVTGAQDVSTIITGGSQSGTAAQGKGSAR